jgi:membrane peptidoglycan carboxypeptidase
MKRFAIAGSVIIAGVIGATYLFIREPYRELSAMIVAAQAPVRPAVLRSALIAAEEPRDRGGAAFTDQLIKYTTASRRRGLARIAQAVLVRVALDARFNEEQILAAYAERVYLGPNASGFSQGAQFYFRKTPSELTIAEAATLAAVVRSPRYYSPHSSPDRALKRRNEVLREMHARRMISNEELDVALAEPLRGHARSVVRP